MIKARKQSCSTKFILGNLKSKKLFLLEKVNRLKCLNSLISFNTRFLIFYCINSKLIIIIIKVIKEMDNIVGPIFLDRL